MVDGTTGIRALWCPRCGTQTEFSYYRHQCGIWQKKKKKLNSFDYHSSDDKFVLNHKTKHPENIKMEFVKKKNLMNFGGILLSIINLFD